MRFRHLCKVTGQDASRLGSGSGPGRRSSRPLLTLLQTRPRGLRGWSRGRGRTGQGDGSLLRPRAAPPAPSPPKPPPPPPLCWGASSPGAFSFISPSPPHLLSPRRLSSPAGLGSLSTGRLLRRRVSIIQLRQRIITSELHQGRCGQCSPETHPSQSICHPEIEFEGILIIIIAFGRACAVICKISIPLTPRQSVV